MPLILNIKVDRFISLNFRTRFIFDLRGTKSSIPQSSVYNCDWNFRRVASDSAISQSSFSWHTVMWLLCACMITHSYHCRRRLWPELSVTWKSNNMSAKAPCMSRKWHAETLLYTSQKTCAWYLQLLAWFVAQTNLTKLGFGLLWREARRQHWSVQDVSASSCTAKCVAVQKRGVRTYISLQSRFKWYSSHVSPVI